MARSGVPLLKPFTRTISFGALCKQAWGDEWGKKDTAYEFSNGRKFQASEPNGGPYTGTATGS
jgi:anti-sigma-K factor RskA